MWIDEDQIQPLDEALTFARAGQPLPDVAGDIITILTADKEEEPPRMG
jgi:hypothetical protein